jgi:predicted phage tail protein
MSLRRKIIVHGYLAELCPEPIYLFADTVAEAIQGLGQATGRALEPSLNQGRHMVKVLGFDSLESLTEPTDVVELHIIPSYSGGKSGGIFQVIIGLLIVATALVVGGPLLAGSALTLWGSVALVGATMVLGGLLSMLSPSPKIDTGLGSQDPEASKYLASTRNTVKIGTRIPYLFGRFPVFGQFLSFNIDAKDVVNPVPAVPITTTLLGNVYYHGV